MGILDPAKLAVVVVIAFLVLGPERFPGVARRLGSTVRHVSEFRAKAESEIRESVAGVDFESVKALRPTALASRFVDDLVREDHASQDSAISPVTAQWSEVESGSMERQERSAVGLERMLALSSPLGLGDSESRLDDVAGTASPENVLMN